MGSLGIYDETESLPGSVKLCKKRKSSRKSLDDKDAVNHASVPRKTRSAMKRRGHESANPSLSTSLKQNRACNEVGKLRKNGLKKSKLSMKPGHLTKDEEEVAETLYALADMFSHAPKKDKPGMDRKPTINDSSTALETALLCDTAVRTPGGDDMKIPVEAGCHSSNSLDSPQLKFKSLDDSRHLEYMFNKQSPPSVSSEVQSDSSIDPRSKISELGAILNDHATAPEQVVASGIKYLPTEDKCNGLILHPGLLSVQTPSSETLESFPRNKLPSWLEKANLATQSCVTQEIAAKNQVGEVETSRPWKRCSAHVHISRWIKVSSQTREQLPENPARIKIDQHVELEPSLNIENQKTRHGHESSLQTQSECSKSSVWSSSYKLCSDFLSLDGVGCGADAIQTKPSMFFSQTQNLSSLHGQPLTMMTRQPPPYLSAHANKVTDQSGHSRELLPSPLQVCSTGVCTKYFPMLQHGPSLANRCQELFPDLCSVRGSKQQQFSQQKFGAISSRSLSDAMRLDRNLSLGLERDRNVGYPEKMTHLQLLCSRQYS